MRQTSTENLVTIIGGAGYLGAPLVRMLANAGYPVRIFDNFQFGRDSLGELELPGVEIVEGDICDIRAVSNAIAGSETVVHLAAMVGRRVEDIPRPYIREVNLLAASVIVDASIEHGVSRFLFASTDSVYGVQSGVMYETGVPDPVSLYSRLKLRMEEQVIRSKRRSFHPTALRIATCYGYSPRMRFDLLVNGLIRDAVVKGEISIAAGEQCRALVHVEDAARAVLSCMRAHVSLVSGQVFNVSSNEQSYQLNQLVTMVRNIVPDVRVHFLGLVPDLVDYHLSSSKLQKMCDYQPSGNVEIAMNELRDMLISGRFSDPYEERFHNT